MVTRTVVRRSALVHPRGYRVSHCAKGRDWLLPKSDGDLDGGEEVCPGPPPRVSTVVRRSDLVLSRGYRVYRIVRVKKDWLLPKSDDDQDGGEEVCPGPPPRVSCVSHCASEERLALA
ncbi:hypothetical protein J6590_007653 [Homalodisca vitripennis]|nr:hypothetical protein J6590_007653 [Homalodisca vitripennis]